MSTKAETGALAQSAFAAWTVHSERLAFVVGGLCLREVSVPGVILESAFVGLSTDLAATCPRWQDFGPNLEVAVVPAQPIEGDLPTMVVAADTIRYATSDENRYYIRLQGALGQYLGKFSRKSRQTLLRKVRRFADFSGGSVHWCEYRSGEEMLAFLKIAREISRKTHHAKSGHGLRDSEEVRNRIVGLAIRDLVRGYILFHGEQPIAYALCPTRGESLIYDDSGYDPEFGKWSPGTVLLYLILEKLFSERKFAILDFSGTEHDYKAFFATGSMRCARILYFRRTWRNLVLVAAHIGVTSVSGVIGRGLRLLHLKDWIKSVLQTMEGRKYSRMPERG